MYIKTRSQGLKEQKLLMLGFLMANILKAIANTYNCIVKTYNKHIINQFVCTGLYVEFVVVETLTKYNFQSKRKMDLMMIPFKSL